MVQPVPVVTDVQATAFGLAVLGVMVTTQLPTAVIPVILIAAVPSVRATEA